MKALIRTTSPRGYQVTFESEEDTSEGLLRALPDLENLIRGAGYLPNGQAPQSPEGLPICTRHNEVMRLRQKQGADWYSHKMINDNGEILWCKGRAGADSPGWDVNQARTQPDPPAEPSQAEAKPRAKPTLATEVYRTDANAKEITDANEFYALVNDLAKEDKDIHNKVSQVLQKQGTWSEKAEALLT